VNKFRKHAGKNAGVQAGRQAGRQASRQGSRQGRRKAGQAGRPAGKQASAGRGAGRQASRLQLLLLLRLPATTATGKQTSKRRGRPLLHHVFSLSGKRPSLPRELAASSAVQLMSDPTGTRATPRPKARLQAGNRARAQMPAAPARWAVLSQQTSPWPAHWGWEGLLRPCPLEAS
jgi:hypothetical protein